MDNLKEKLVETSLSRIWNHFQNHDAALITAFRHTMINCVNDADNTGAELKITDNKSRNNELNASLLKLGYGVTKANGVYIENFNTAAAKQVKEDSYLVVNIKNDPNFIKNIEGLGKHFCQDSVLIVPKGGKGAYLVGTNYADFPGLGQKHPVGDFKPAQSAEFMSSLDKRPFHFAENYGLLESFDKLNNNTKYIVTSLSKKVLNKLND